MSLSDTRFHRVKKHKYFICDACQRRVTYKDQVIPFQGNFLHQGPQSLSEKEKQWSIGMWDATWLCVDCLCVHHGCTKTFAIKHYMGNYSAECEKAKANYQGLGEVVASASDISSDTVAASLVVNELATFVSCTSSSCTAKVMRQTQQDNEISETLAVANYGLSKSVPPDYKATPLETSERSKV